MSVFPGGIFSKARGKTSGVVFSAARTRKGKLMTSRELVIPANPRTSLQQANRTMFSYAQKAVRDMGPGVYRYPFNRGVEDLPGWHSLISLIRRMYWQSGSVTWEVDAINPDTLLGDLHFSDTCTVTRNTSTQATFNYSTENGASGSAGDTVVGGVLDFSIWTDDPGNWGYGGGTSTRGAGSLVINTGEFPLSSDIVGFLLFMNPNAEDPFKRSPAKWMYGE